MRKSVFPRKFGGDVQRHYAILTQALADMHGRQVLELATGAGSAVHFLDPDNVYTGTDISSGLLKRAARRFSAAGFSDSKFYVARAEDLPFNDIQFDLCLCILALNFFDNAVQALQEASRVLVPGGMLLCSVPVPERNALQRTIRGTLYAETELADLCRTQALNYERIPGENGALKYRNSAAIQRIGWMRSLRATPKRLI